jgi:hypothetical protein
MGLPNRASAHSRAAHVQLRVTEGSFVALSVIPTSKRCVRRPRDGRRPSEAAGAPHAEQARSYHRGRLDPPHRWGTLRVCRKVAHQQPLDSVVPAGLAVGPNSAAHGLPEIPRHLGGAVRCGTTPRGTRSCPRYLRPQRPRSPRPVKSLFLSVSLCLSATLSRPSSHRDSSLHHCITAARPARLKSLMLARPPGTGNRLQGAQP